MTQKHAALLASTGFSREFSLGDWRVRPSLNQLERAGETARIEGRAMAVLVELAQTRGALCSKRRLIRAVWGDAFVNEEVVTHAVSELRKALGDDSRKPRFIQTVPRKGYRLLAPVEWASVSVKASSSFPYEIFERIGGGGMGIVYRAEDLRLHRIVAVKFLPPNLTTDANAKARLMREARAAAALEHRNIATVFEVGEDPQGQAFISMAYYSGETLRQKIARGPLPIEVVIRYARQIARGLAVAHGKGIVHRDIKPENIVVDDDDEIKIVDFGLAKIAADPGLTLTNPGVTPGTALYMSPESIRGADVDHRGDLWSLGVVLFEMLLGFPPFQGESTPVVMQAILESKVEAPRLRREDVPAVLDKLVLELLRKDPGRRLESAEQVAERLLPAVGVSPLTENSGPVQLWLGRSWFRLLRVIRGFWQRGARVLAGVLLGAWVASAVWWSMESRDPEIEGTRQVLAFDVRLPPEITVAEGADSSAAISRDGRWVVLIGEDQQGRREPWALSLDGKSVVRLPGSQRPGQPFWSPDGRSVGFFDSNRLFIQSLSGGPPLSVAEVSSEFRGGSWGEGGNILFSPGTQRGIFLVREADGSLLELTRPDRTQKEIGHLWPQFLPDDEHFLYFVSSNDEAIRGVYLASLRRPDGRRILPTSASATYANGHLLYAEGASLLARPFDVERGSFTGPSFSVADGVASFFTYQGVFSASQTGVLVFSKEDESETTEVRWVDMEGATLEVLSQPGVYRNPSMSRDGRYAVVESHRGTDIELIMIELETGRQRRISDDSAHQPMFPVLSADGEQLVFAVEDSVGTDLRLLQPNSTDSPEVLLTSDHPLTPSDWSPDGRVLLFHERTADGDFDIWALEVESRQATRLMDQPHHEGSGHFSPDGRRLAYISNESGQFEVYVEPFPRSGRRCQVSNEGGFDPHWGNDEQVYYLSPAGMLMGVEIDQLTTCTLSRPVSRFDARVEPPPHSRNHFEIQQGGARILVNSTIDAEKVNQVAVIVDWLALEQP